MTGIGRNRRLAWRKAHGNVAIEYALVLPVLLLFIFGIIDIGRAVWVKATLDHAVAAAARCGTINSTICGNAADIQADAAAEAYGLTIDSSAFLVSGPTCGLQVATNFDFVPLFPWTGAGTIVIAASACYPQPPVS